MSIFPTIVCTGPLGDPGPSILSEFGEIIIASSDDEATLLGLVPDAIALIVRGGSRIPESVIDAAPRLRVIGRSGVGFDSVDVDAATRRGIPVVLAPNANANAVAEGALALLLALSKQLLLLDTIVRGGRWQERDRVDVRDLEGSVLGIVGFGRIGRRLATLVQPLGVEVLAFDPYAVDASGSNVELVSFDSLLERSDHLSLHAPLTDETRGLIDLSVLERLGPDASLVNLGRGGLIRSLDELVVALDRGFLSGVALDVFDVEPPDTSHPIFRDPRVVLTPHAIGLSRLSKWRLFEEVSSGVAAVLRGERAAATVNPLAYERS
jgi:D-3-phosphoglycerate dehydrogenase